MPLESTPSTGDGVTLTENGDGQMTRHLVYMNTLPENHPI